MKRAQTTLASTGFEKYTKTTRRAQFLAEMDRVVPWRALCERIEPVYPKAGTGRPPVGVERMLRTQGATDRLESQLVEAAKRSPR